MSNLPLISRFRANPHVIVSDAERDRVTARLNESFEAGDIDADTYRRLLDIAYSATTLGELVPVVEVLPARPAYTEPGEVGRSGALPPGQVNTARSLAAPLAVAIGAGIVIALLTIVLGLL